MSNSEMNVWLESELTDDADVDLVNLVSSSLVYDIDKVRAFTVALLTNVNDHSAAAQVNDVLLGVE